MYDFFRFFIYIWHTIKQLDMKAVSVFMLTVAAAGMLACSSNEAEKETGRSLRVAPGCHLAKGPYI